MTEERRTSVPTAREACKHLRLPVSDDAFENLHMLTVLATLGPHRLDAGRCIVTSRFRCRSFDRRYVVGALSTGRCLPAVAPRVLIMGDEVRSRSSSPDSHFNRFPSHSFSAHLSVLQSIFSFIFEMRNELSDSSPHCGDPSLHSRPALRF